MKSTRTNAINQRIERITMNHAIIGIDIVKDVHVAQLLDFRGRVLTKRHLSFTNSLEGFEKLQRWIQAEQRSISCRRYYWV